MPIEMPTKPARLDAAAATPRATQAREVSTCITRASGYPQQWTPLTHWARRRRARPTSVFASTELPELKILAITDHNNCLYSATNQHGDSSDDRIQAPQQEPKFFAITTESNCQHDATKPDDINPKTLRPPSSLTTDLTKKKMASGATNPWTERPQPMPS